MTQPAGRWGERRAEGRGRAWLVPPPEHAVTRPAPPQPPSCPRGWATGPPDYVGVGAQRAGTTWWHALIKAHAEVGPAPSHKELHFFDVFWRGGFEQGDVARYHRYFARPVGQLAGEWTPEYMYDAWTPRLLAACAPAAKLIAILRDPLDRCRSWLRVAASQAGESGAFLGGVTGEALGRSLYYEQVQRLLRHFPREQLLLLQFERCVEQPARELRRTYEFLGVGDVEFVPPATTQPSNESRGRLELPRQLEQEMRAAFESDVRRLLELEPQLDIGLWPSVRDRL